MMIKNESIVIASSVREKIRKLLPLAGVNGMEDIRELFRETVNR